MKEIGKKNWDYIRKKTYRTYLFHTIVIAVVSSKFHGECRYQLEPKYHFHVVQ